MSRGYIQRPDGKWAVWSTVVDDFIADELPFEELKKWVLEDAIERAVRLNDRFWEHWEDVHLPRMKKWFGTYEEREEFARKVKESDRDE